MQNEVELSREFNFGNDRLVLVKPGPIQGENIERNARSRLEKIFSSFKRENYFVEEAKNKDNKLEELKLNGRTDLKEGVGQLSFDKSLSGIAKGLKRVIGNYWENIDKRNRIKEDYAEITQDKPLSDAELYQGGEKRFEIERTTEFLSNLLEKEIKVNRTFDKTEANVADNFVKATIQHVGDWKSGAYDIRKLRKRDYYKIMVCPEEFIFDYLDKLVQVISDGRISSLGTRLKVLPGSVVLIESGGFQNKLEIRTPIELQEGLHPRPFKLTFKE